RRLLKRSSFMASKLKCKWCEAPPRGSPVAVNVVRTGPLRQCEIAAVRRYLQCCGRRSCAGAPENVSRSHLPRHCEEALAAGEAIQHGDSALDRFVAALLAMTE